MERYSSSSRCSAAAIWLIQRYQSSIILGMLSVMHVLAQPIRSAG
jgi:hypothetical protein